SGDRMIAPRPFPLRFRGGASIVGVSSRRVAMSSNRSLFIDGRSVSSDRVSTVRSPWDGSEVATVALGGREEMEAATAASLRGFDAMRRLSRRQRSDILARTAQ